MKHYTLLVIGTVLVMVAAVMMATGAYEESVRDIKLVDEMSTRSLLEEIDGRIVRKLNLDNPGREDFRYYFNTYNELNLIFSDQRMDSVLNFKYDIAEHEARDLWLFNIVEEPTPEEENEVKEINIPYGHNGTQITAQLAEKGLIKNYDKFLRLLIELGIDKKLKAGNYRFNSQDTAVEVLLSLTGK